MSAFQQSHSYTQDHPLSVSHKDTIPKFFKKEQQVQLRHSNFRSISPIKSLSASASSIQYDTLLPDVFSNKLDSLTRIFFHKAKVAIPSISFSGSTFLNQTSLYSFKEIFLPLDDIFYKNIKNEILNVYSERQKANWDGYGAEPIKYLSQALHFAKDLFLESRSLTQSVDIIPENDGCLCFEWFKSDNKLISISVGSERLAYNYKLGDEEAWGEVSFSGKQMLIEKIKKII